MKRRFLRRLVLPLAVTMAVMMLASCGSGESESDTSQRVPGGSVAEEDKQLINNCYTAGFPIAEEPVTLKVMVKNYTGLSDFSDVAFIKQYEELTNVKLDFTIVGEADVKTMVQLAYTADNLPDIFLGMAPTGGMTWHWDYIQQGLVQPLDEYIDTFAPNVRKLFDENPDAEYLCTGLEDNHIYMFPYVNATSGSLFHVSWINTQWLETLGLSMPTTTDEFVNVLRAFRDGDPNGNNIKDEIPLTFPQNFSYNYLSPFGIGTDYQPYFFTIVNGEPEFVGTSNAYKEALTFYASLFKEGLIDQKSFQQSSTDIITNMNGMTDVYGIVGGNMNATPYLVNDMDRFYNNYSILEPFTAEGYTYQTMQTKHEAVWAEWFIVTDACQYPEIAVRWADWLYSEEGTMWAENGPPGEGMAWNYDGDNFKMTMENLPDGMTKSEWYNTLTIGHCLPRYNTDSLKNRIIKNTDPSTMSPEEKIVAKQEEATALFTPYLAEEVYSSLNFSAEDSAFISENAQKINDMTNEYQKAFINGTYDVTTMWDQYVTELNELGLERYMEIVKTTYAEYKSKMAS